MKRRIAYYGLVAAAVLLASCSRISTSAPSRGPQHGNGWTIPGTIRIVDNQEPNALLKLFSNQAAADDTTALLFEPMFRYDDKGNPVPALATEFPTPENGLVSKDGLRITFKLRPNARWSDGVPVTAQDVIYTWHVIVDGNNPVISTAGYDKIRTIVADNPHQVTMVLKEPVAPDVYLFSEGTYAPLPAHILSKYQRIDRLPYDSDPIGDGPYVLKEWIHGSDLIFGPNPYYWRGPPHLQRLDVKIIPNDVTQVSELRTHDIDVLDGVTKTLVPQAAAVEGTTVIKQLTANYRHLDFNLKNPILADRTVRRAIAMTIDKERIIHDVYGGFGVPGAEPLPPMSWAATDIKPLPHDPVAAAASLDADGWKLGTDGVRTKNGVRLSLTISTATENLPNINAEQIIAAELKRIGIDVVTKNYATTILFAPDGPLRTGNYDMSWIVDTEGTDPDYLGLIGCDYFAPHGANTDYYCNPRVDALLRDAQVHYAQARRRSDYDAVGKILVQDAPFVVIYWDVSVSVYNSDLKNFRPSPFVTDYWNAWEWHI